MRLTAIAVIAAALVLGTSACSGGSSHPSTAPTTQPTGVGTTTPTPAANHLTGLGATKANWLRAHGGLNTETFTVAGSVPFIYSFKQTFPPMSVKAAQSLVKKQLPPDAQEVGSQVTRNQCLKVFYHSDLMQQVAPGLGNQLSTFFYSAGQNYDPSKVVYAIVSNLGTSTNQAC